MKQFIAGMIVAAICIAMVLVYLALAENWQSFAGPNCADTSQANQAHPEWIEKCLKPQPPPYR